MGNGPQRQPVYTPEELERANKAFRELGLPEQDIFGDFVGEPTFTTPVRATDETPDARSTVTTMAPAPGPEQLLPAEQERRAFQDVQDTFNSLRKAYVQDLILRGFENVPEMQDSGPDDPLFGQKIQAAADRMAREAVEREIGPGLVPGFPLGGFAAEGERQMKFPERMVGGIVPAPAPAPPADLPPREAAPTLGTALRPQTRVGPEVAGTVMAAARVREPEEIIKARGLDPQLHVKYAERERLQRLRDLGQDTEEDFEEFNRLNAYIKDAEARGKSQFSDITEIAQIRSFDQAVKKFFENESNARTFSQSQGAQKVLESIQALPDLLAGRGKPDQYKTQRPEAGVVGSFLGAQVKEGKVPILDKIQRDFLESYVVDIDKANLEVLPYIQQFERAAETGLDLAPTGRPAPASSIGLEDEGPPDIGEVTGGVFLDPPEPISMEDAQKNYKRRLVSMRPPDFYAVDFWSNPDLYLQEEGLVSFFNQSYPSGASVEQPANVLFRWIAAPFNVSSTALYETARGRGPIGSVLNYNPFGIEVPGADDKGLREPTEVEKIAHGMDPLYAGHPYLRAVAENRNIGNDIYDLYWYNGYKDFAIVPGALATIADMFVTPGSFGIGPAVKATSAALKAERIAKAVGMPRLSAKFAKDASSDALRAAAKSFAETSPLLNSFVNSSALKLTDPAEFGALRATEFMQGADAYRAAREDIIRADLAGGLDKPSTLASPDLHERTIAAARESLGVGERGNSFLDFAKKKGADWSVATADGIADRFPGAADFNQYRRRILDVMTGTAGAVKNERLTRRLLDIFSESHLTDDLGVAIKGSDVIADKDDLLGSLSAIFKTFGPSGYAKFMEPLNYRFAQKGIVDVLEKSPLTRGAWKSVKHVTPTLLVSEPDIPKLMDLVTKDDVTKKLLDIQSTMPRKHGLHKSRDARFVIGGSDRFNPKVGSYLVVDDFSADAIEEIVQDLSQQGYLNAAQAESILMGLRDDYSEILTPEFIAKTGLSGDGFGKIITSDNLRTLFNANIERLAFANKIGVDVEAFETATGATKQAIREPLEARHLSQSWPKRLFNRVWPASFDKKAWSKLFPPDTPLNVVRALETMRGKVSQMNVKLRRDINNLMQDPELQQAYFTDDFLKTNKVSQDDAIVALALGPRSTRAFKFFKEEYQESLLSIMTATTDSLSLDFLDAFKPASVSRSTISDGLTVEGKQNLQEIFERQQARIGISLQTAQSADDFLKVLDDLHKQLNDLAANPKNFKDPTVISQIAAPDFGNITSGFYYLQRQREIVAETVDDISSTWPGFTDAKTNLDRFTFSEAPGLSKVESPLLKDLVAQLQMSEVSVPLPDRAMYATPAQMVGKRIEQIVSSRGSVAGLPGDSLRASMRTIDEFFDMLFVKVGPRDDIVVPPGPDLPPRPGFLTPAGALKFRPGRDARKPVKDLTPADLNAEAERFREDFIQAFQSEIELMPEVVGGEGSAYSIILEAHDAITEIAEQIIRVNNMKTTNVDEQLSMLDNIFTQVLGEKGTTRAQIDAVLPRRLVEEASYQLVEDALRGLNITKTVEKELAKATQVRQVREALLGLFDTNPTIGYRVAKSIDSALKWYTRSAYQQILAGRPAFHAVNIATGPLLTWGTVGGRAALDSVKEAWPAAQVMTAAAFRPRPLRAVAKQYDLNPALSKVIVTDPFGRSYTVGDILDLAFSEGALRSRTSVTLSPTQFADMLSDARIDSKYGSYLTRGLGKLFKTGVPQAGVGAAVGAPSIPVMAATGASGLMGLPTVTRVGRQTQLQATDLARFLSDLTETEDNFYRLATVIGALRRGDDPIQALGVGRRALLDYGSLSGPEKWAMSRFAMFYSFWRLNGANALGVMLSNPKRFVNIARITQTGGRVFNALQEDQGTDMGLRANELDFYKHSFLLSRPVIDYIEGSNQETHYQVLPGVPILDGAITVAQLMFAPGPAAWVDPIQGLIAPLPGALAGKEPSYQWRKKYVDPRDMYVLDKTWWGNYFFDVIIGEKPRGVPAPAGQEAWQGQEWRLSEAGMKRYLQWKNGVGQVLITPGIVTNSTLPITLLASQELGITPERELTGRRFPTDPVESLLSSLGLVKDVGAIPISSARTKMLQDMARRLKQIERSRQDPTFREEERKIKKR